MNGALQRTLRNSTHTGSWVKLDAIRWTGEYNIVYNFRVAEDHTYFVGKENWGFSVWVHNTYKPIGLGKDYLIHELGNEVSLARRHGWTGDGLTRYLSDAKDQFFDAFHEATRNATEIRFNLNGVKISDMWMQTRGLSSIGSVGKGLVTEWELRKIMSNPNLLEKTTFIFGPRSVQGTDIDGVYEFLLAIQTGRLA